MIKQSLQITVMLVLGLLPFILAGFVGIARRAVPALLLFGGELPVLAAVLPEDKSAAGGDSLAEAELAFMSDLFNILQYNEHQTRDMLWALEYVQRAVETPDWNTLQRAHAVLETAGMYIVRRAQPELKTTDAQYSLLMKKYGMDVYALRINGGSMNTNYLNDLKIMRTDLQTSFFKKTELKRLAEELSLLEEIYQAGLDGDACMSAYLLKLLEPAESAQKLRLHIRDCLPLINARLPSDTLALTEMENLENEILDREEAALKRLNELLNVRTAEVFIMGDILKNSDASALTRVSTPIANLSETLPMPGWYYSQTAEYTWLLDNGDVHRLPSELENLSENPSVLHMKCTDVQREDLSAYAESLKGFGYSAILEESGGTVKYYLLRDDWQMSMVWNDETVKINLFGHLPCFVPTWYRPQ